MEVLSVNGLSVAINNRYVIDDLSFTIRPGETFALVGESGSGKSMTALALMGLLPQGAQVTAGQIMLCGQDLTVLPPRDLIPLRGARIGMIFQEPMTSLNPVLTIGRQMTEAIEVHLGLGRAAARKLAADMLGRVDLSDPMARLGQYPHELSGGMRQRVMIGMTMVLKPALLIADEPTTALDVTVQAQILNLMRALEREMVTSLLLITHNMGVVAEIADRVAVMQHGSIVESDAVSPLFAQPAQPYTRALLAAVPRLDAPLRSDAPTSRGSPVLELRGISRSFGRPGFLRRGLAHAALTDVSVDLHRSETLALVGESGSGKSTLGRIATRLDLDHAGQVFIDRQDVTRLRGRALRLQRAKVQIVFQDPFASLDPRFTARATLSEPLALHRGLSGAAKRAEAAQLMERVGLPEAMLDRLPHELSGGQRQRIAIARALAANPQVIVADEPTSAIDVSVQARIIELLIDIQKDTGLALLFVTHDLGLVRLIAHRVAVLRGGRILELGSAAQVLDTPQHPYTQSLLAAAPIPDPAWRDRPRVSASLSGGSKEELHGVSRGHWVAG